MTKVQKITFSAIILYFVWEISVWVWTKTEAGPIIRVDLIIIYPILIVLAIWSAWQYFRK